MFSQCKWILIYNTTVIILLLHSTTCVTDSKNVVKFAGIVRNIVVYAVEDENSLQRNSTTKSLKLNVSWMPPDEGRQPSWYRIVVTSIPKNKSECKEGSAFYIIQNVTQLSLLVPKELNSMPESIQIHPNCTYKIQVHAYPRVKPEGKLSEVIYTVPECVGRKCCAGAKDTLPIPTVEAIHTTGKVIINWYVRSNSNVHSYAISIGTPLFTSNAGHSVYNITRISNVASTINTFTWNSRFHNQYIKEKNSYKIFVEAIDHRGCLGTRGDFTINTTSYGNIIWIFIGVIICVTILGFVSQYFVPLYNKKDQYQLLQLPRILRRRQTMSELSDCKLQWPEETCCKVHENNEFEVSYKYISLQHELGKGHFGRVYLGTLNNNMDTLVAVKMSQCSDTTNEPEARRQLLEEIETMKTAGPHPYLVGLIGCCTSPDDPICILLEYMEGGNLLAYLHSRRKMEPNVIPLCNFEKPVSRYVNIIEEDRFKDEDLHYKIEKQQIVEFALNIAKGMEHLEYKGITHRDLAARNILLTLDLIPKISDFGLSRNGIYVINNMTGKVHQLPIRWMSPEAVRDHIFSSKSDVWSFGIVLWEIGTLGSFPYPNIKDEDLLHYLTQDKCRLTCPDTISCDIYEIMCSCWKTAPQERPSFAQLVLDLQILKESLYSVHDASNPCYMLLSQ